MGAESSYLRDVLDRIIDSIPTAPRQSSRPWPIATCSAPTTPTRPTRTSRRKPTPAPPVHMGEGVVLKYNASQKYTTNAVSGAIFKEICRKAGCAGAGVHQPRR